MVNYAIILVAFAAYILSTLIKIHHQNTYLSQKNSDIKMIPAEIIFTTIPINIANAINPDSFFRLFKDDLRIILIVFLILLSLICYAVSVYLGRKLHIDYEDFAIGDLKDGKNITQASLVVFFLLVTGLIAGL